MSDLRQILEHLEAHQDVDAAIAELLKAIGATGRNGSVTLKIKAERVTDKKAKRPTGATPAFKFTYDIDTNLPKPTRPAVMLFQTPDGLTARDPYQKLLSFEDVIPDVPEDDGDGDPAATTSDNESPAA